MYALPQAAVTRRRQPQFGWGWAGHTAIEKASVELQPTGAFKSFLKEQLPLINATSINQDKYHAGGDHFVNLETMAQAQYATSHRSFAQVDQVFSAAAARQKASEFASKPLQPGNFNHFANVFQKITVLYQQLVGQLAGLQGRRRMNAESKEKTKEAIAETVGALSHYVGDLHQPMHTSHYYSWPLAYGGRGGSHAYLESSLFQTRDYPGWQSRLLKKEKGAPCATLSDAQVEDRMLRQVEAGYLKMYDLVAVDRQARAHSEPSDYFSELRRGWKTLASERMDTCARNLADILNSAWVAAGQPDMKVLKFRADFQ